MILRHSDRGAEIWKLPLERRQRPRDSGDPFERGRKIKSLSPTKKIFSGKFSDFFNGDARWEEETFCVMGDDAVYPAMQLTLWNGFGGVISI